MKRCIPPLALGLTLIGASSAALADVKYLDVRTGGIYLDDGRVVVRPVNGKHTEIEKDETRFHLEFKAGCQGLNQSLSTTEVAFGQVITVGKVVEGDLDRQTTMVPNYGKKEIGWTAVELFVRPSKLGGSNDPVTICQNWVNERLSQGATLRQVLAKDKTIIKPVSLSGVASCMRPSGKGIDWKSKTMDHQLIVVCKAGSVGAADDIEVKPAPLSPVTSFSKRLEVVASRLKALSPNMVGQCPASMPFQAEIQADAAGEVGYEINFPSNAGTPAQKRTGTLVFDGPGTKKTPIVEFTASSGYPVGVATLVIDQPGQNKASDHFKVQCVQAPVAGGLQFVPSQGSPLPATRPVRAVVPPPPPPRAIQAQPSQPASPPRALQAAPVTPPPAPPRAIQAQPAQPPKPPRDLQSAPVAPPPPPPRAVQLQPLPPQPLDPALSLQTAPVAPEPPARSTRSR